MPDLDYASVRTHELRGAGGRADEHDPAAAHGHCLGLGLLVGNGVHGPAAEHQIGRRLGVRARYGCEANEKSESRADGQHSPNTTSITLVPVSPGRSNAPTASSAG